MIISTRIVIRYMRSVVRMGGERQVSRVTLAEGGDDAVTLAAKPSPPRRHKSSARSRGVKRAEL